MDLSIINKDHLHHAYFIEGDHEILVPKILDYLESESIANKNDVITETIPVFYIENSRELKNKQQMVSDGKRIIIIAFDRIILAAQQALLKTLEEPTPNTHFFFVSRNSSVLLPTVRSRMFILNRIERSDTREEDNLAKDFLKSDYYGRGEQIKNLIDDARSDNDEEKAIAKRNLIRFLDGLERELSDKLHFDTSLSVDIADSIKVILKAKKDMEDPSPSVKMIFEHLCLRLMKL